LPEVRDPPSTQAGKGARLVIYVNTWFFLVTLGVAIFGPSLCLVFGAMLGRNAALGDNDE
jgi:hypothetical protein